MNQHRLARAAIAALWTATSATLCAAAPIPITGKVVDSSGKALASARVELAPLARKSGPPGTAVPKPVATAASDGSGAFSFAAPATGMWTVRVEASGFVPGQFDLVPLLEAVELPPAVLQSDAGPRMRVDGPPGESSLKWRYAPASKEATSHPVEAPDVRGLVTGKVVDRVTGKSLPGALVWPREEPAAFVRTDAAGVYTLTLPPSKEPRLAAAAVNYLQAQELPGKTFALAPRPGRPAFGVVVDESGRPVATARVSLLPSEESGEAEKPMLASSDRQGRFRIEALPAAARLDLEARAPGFVPTLVRGLAVIPWTAGAVDLGRLILTRETVLEGHVEDSEGQPLDGAVVHLRKTDPAAERLARAGSLPKEVQVTTGAGGQFEVGGLKPGERVGLFVEKDGYASRTVAGLQAPAAEPVRIVLSPASRLAGRVVDESGAPVSAAQVALSRREGDSMSLAKVGQTDGEGRFTLDRVEAGRFALEASAQGYVPGQVEEVEVTAGKDVQDLEVVLRVGAAVEGTVTTPDGSPAAGAVVRALVLQEEGATTFAVVPETRADDEGRYRLQGLTQGRYSVAAEHPGWQRTARDLVVRDDDTRLDLRLREGFEMAGRAVDASGRAVSGARIGLSSPDGSDRETVTGTDGGFRFAGVGEGRHSLRAEKEGYGRPPAEEVQVAGGPVRGVELRLDRGVTVTGRVLGLEFQDLARVQVAAARDGISGEQAARTDYQGRYRVADLEPGDWILLARLPDGRLVKSRVAVPPGAGEISLDLEFERGLALTGRVVAGSAPVAGAVVYASAGDGAGSGGGVSGLQGEFRIEGLRPGTYDLTVTVPRGGAPHRRTLELRGDREIVIALPAAEP